VARSALGTSFKIEFYTPIVFAIPVLSAAGATGFTFFRHSCLVPEAKRVEVVALSENINMGVKADVTQKRKFFCSNMARLNASDLGQRSIGNLSLRVQFRRQDSENRDTA
jgi:hypothetical protein